MQPLTIKINFVTTILFKNISGKNTFNDKIKRRSKRNRFKKKYGDNFEIKFNYTKVVTDNNRLRISIYRPRTFFI